MYLTLCFLSLKMAIGWPKYVEFTVCIKLALLCILDYCTDRGPSKSITSLLFYNLSKYIPFRNREFSKCPVQFTVTESYI